MRITGLRSFMARDGLRPRVIVALDTSEGITGWGEAYNHGPDRALAPILDYLCLQIAGEDPRRIERLHQKMLQHARFPPGALGLAAIAAIDHCLWDIKAKALGVPVYELLGGAVRDRVRVYLGVYAAPEATEVRDHCAAAHEAHGFTAFKMSPYRADIHADPWRSVLRATTDWVAALTEMCPDWEFAFDAHARLFEPWQAVSLGNALAPFHPLFFEEPIRPENIEAWGALNAKLSVPLATGECLYSRWEFLRLLQCAGADIVQPDIAVVGGLSEMIKIAHIASAFYVPVAPHNPMGPLATAHALHFSAACTNFKILEYRMPGTAAMLGRGLQPAHDPAGYVFDPYLPKDGFLELRPDRPGWGLEIDEGYLQTDRYIHWDRTLPVRPDGSTGYT
ncbi:MAG: mandelate racemase/muconate lactonizing enzyme family protein [Pseudomonadota bacterium]